MKFFADLYRVVFKRIFKLLYIKLFVRDLTLNEVIRNGYVLKENYLTEQECDELNLSLANSFVKYKDRVWTDSLGSDQRLYGIDRVQDKFQHFFNSSTKRYFNSFYCSQKLYGFFLGANLKFVDGNSGSGGGWHRDSIAPQLKAIIYLSDVEHFSGPFQLIPNSHKLFSFLRLIRSRISWRKTRFNESEINEVFEDNIVEVTAKKGTLILVDTSIIHRGKPIENGERQAITFYCWKKGIPDHINSLLVKE